MGRRGYAMPTQRRPVMLKRYFDHAMKVNRVEDPEVIAIAWRAAQRDGLYAYNCYKLIYHTQKFIDA